MRTRLQAFIVVTAVLLGTAAFPVRAAEPSAVGLWEQVDESSGKAESWFKITERNGVYEGAIVKIFFKPARTRTGPATDARAPSATRRCSG